MPVSKAVKKRMLDRCVDIGEGVLVRKEVFLSEDEKHLIINLTHNFRYHEVTDGAGIIGCNICFYRYKDGVLGGRGSRSLVWMGSHWDFSSTAPKKHSRIVKYNNPPEEE